MIIDSLKNANKYYHVNKKFEDTFKYIDKLIKENAEPGKYVLEEGVVFGTIQDSETKAKDQAKFEGHYKFIDIQIALNEAMDVYVRDANSLKISEDLRPGKDMVYYEKPSEWTLAHIKAGEFIIIFPGEAHAPGIAPNEPSKVRKIVLKVPDIT